MYQGSPIANAGGAGTSSPPVPPSWPARPGGYSPDAVPPAPQPVQQQPQQPQQQQQQAQYQTQPQPNGGYGQQPASYNQQPSQPPQAPQVPVRVELNENHILDGPGVPPELRGRTVGQAMRIYGTLADSYLRRQPVQQPNQAQQPPQNQPAPQPPRQVPNQVQQPRNGSGQYQSNPGWDQPNEPQQPDIRQVIREELQPYAQNASVAAMESARRQIPDFNELEADILQQLDGMPQQVLVNPQAWIRAADLARGAKMRTRFNGAQQPGGNSGGYGAPQHNGVSPANGMSVPANSYGLQPHQFFSESPTPPVFGQEYGLSASEQAAAAAFGMAPDEYRAWKGGVTQR